MLNSAIFLFLLLSTCIMLNQMAMRTPSAASLIVVGDRIIMQIGMVGYFTISNVLLRFQGHCMATAMSLFFQFTVLLRATIVLWVSIMWQSSLPDLSEEQYQPLNQGFTIM